MTYKQIGRPLCGLVLAALLATVSGCHRPAGGVSVPGQITGDNWGEQPAANQTLPGGFTVEKFTTESAVAESTAGKSTAGTLSPFSGTQPQTTAPGAAGSGTLAGSTAAVTSASGITTAHKTGSTAGTTTTTLSPAPVVTGELRGIWLCHLDTKAMFRNKSVEQARAALDQVMDHCAAYGMNAVFFHVRSDSDAYYPSGIFRPAAAAEALIEAGFDPLAYAVEAAHKQGLQLHAWVNPYRIGADESYAVGEPEDRFWKYKSRENGSYTGKAWYYVPSSAAAQKIILDGVREIVEGYDVDGVHFDDYFYPYDSDSNLGINAKAPESFESDFHSEGRLSLADWRRAAVDSLVMRACDIVHKKDRCVFGISPSHNIQRAYDSQYADLPQWLAGEGYVDYLCPQIYFGFKHQSSAFDKCVQEWLALPRNPRVALYVGMAAYKIGVQENPAWAGADAVNEWVENKDLMAQEITYLREQSGINGMLFFRYDFFDADKEEIQKVLPLLKK